MIAELNNYFDEFDDNEIQTRKLKFYRANNEKESRRKLALLTLIYASVTGALCDSGQSASDV